MEEKSSFGHAIEADDKVESRYLLSPSLAYRWALVAFVGDHGASLANISKLSTTK
jgi:hypothetical protein